MVPARIATAAQGRRIAECGWLDNQGRQARQSEGRAADRGIPGVRARVGTAPCALSEGSRGARHRCARVPWSSRCNIARAFRISMTHHDEPYGVLVDAGRHPSKLLLKRLGKHQKGSFNYWRCYPVVDELVNKGGGGQRSQEPRRRLLGALSRAACWPRLGGGLVQAFALDRLLGMSRAGNEAALHRLRHSGNWAVRFR